MSLGKTKLPRKSRIVNGACRSCTGTSIITRDQDNLCTCFCYTSCYRTNTSFRYQFYRDTCLRVCIFQVVDQLCQILDGVNIMMRRRRDQAHTWCGQTGLCDPRIDFSTRQMSTLSWFCTLSHLDLNLLCTYQISGSNTKTSTCHLLDRRAFIQSIRSDSQTFNTLTALTGIRFTMELIHGNSQTLMGFLRNRSIGHGTGLKTGHDGLYALYFLQRNSLLRIFEIQKGSELSMIVFTIYQRGILLEQIIVAFSG